MKDEVALIIDRIENLEKRFDTLEKAMIGHSKRRKREHQKKPNLTNDVDYSVNERAFIKRYASGKSGPKKFTILVAYLANRKVEENVELREIVKHWNKMKSLLGQFNRFYPNEAKTQGWVDSKKRGSYNLTNEWKNVL